MLYDIYIYIYIYIYVIRRLKVKSESYSSVLKGLILFDNLSFPLRCISSVRLEEAVKISIFGHRNCDFIAHFSSAVRIQYGIVCESIKMS